MIRRLRTYLAQTRKVRRLRRKYMEEFARWLAQNPGGTYGQFYAVATRQRIDTGDSHPTLGVTSVRQQAVRSRAQRVLADFKRAGCAPHHVVVDYGCGSLWVGEAFMEYLDPGNYVGLDVSDAFYAEGLARLGPAMVESRKPSLRVISDDVLRDVRDRGPDFIVSLAVMQHVPPADLPGFLARIVSLATPRTRIEIGALVGFRTTAVSVRKWQHSRHVIRAALAPLGCAAEYRRDRRIMPTTPGFSLVRRR
jgi:hypothetical protein